MKNSNLIILALLTLTSLISCTKEEPITCSCVTTVYGLDDKTISSVSSAEEAPITDNCADLYSRVFDPETELTTTTRCN